MKEAGSRARRRVDARRGPHRFAVMDRLRAPRLRARPGSPNAVGVMITVALALLVATGCERRSATPSKDTALPIVTLPESLPAAAPAAPSAWDPSAGPALFVPGPSPEDGLVVIPAFTDTVSLDSVHVDASVVQGAQVELYARSGVAGRAVVASTRGGGSGARPGECATWPSARLTPASGGSIAPWTVGFAVGSAELIASDSISGLTGADSTRLTREIARLASSLPNDTAQAFRSLPFVVRSGRRFEVPPGVQALVTLVVRTLNVEANPRQEQLLIVAERDSGGAGPWQAGYVERSSGTEEELVSNDVLAIVRLGAPRRATIVLGREVGEGASYELLERVGPRRWRVRWTSAYAGC